MEQKQLLEEIIEDLSFLLVEEKRDSLITGALCDMLLTKYQHKLKELEDK